jgi:hypothetical protein
VGKIKSFDLIKKKIKVHILIAINLTKCMRLFSEMTREIVERMPRKVMEYFTLSVITTKVVETGLDRAAPACLLLLSRIKSVCAPPSPFP